MSWVHLTPCGAVEEEVATDGGEDMVAGEGESGGEGVHEWEAGLGDLGHGDGYGAVELDDLGGDEDDDAGPIGFGD
ncbi:MAG: hypothetical protein IPP47_06770 [Bryobacterales bacterium]|nr:hypothetical protein [Bryobacterales bacterium]